LETLKYGTIQPRFLRYRNHYKLYVFFLLFMSLMLAGFWIQEFRHSSFSQIWQFHQYEFSFSMFFFFFEIATFFFWMKPHMDKKVQVFDTHLFIHYKEKVQEVRFEDIQAIKCLWRSIFFLKMKDGRQFYFNSHLERLDYVWEGIHSARPDLLPEEEFQAFRLKLVQYDHHQRRKEWFFRHKSLDAFQWFALPTFFMMAGYIFQSHSVIIHQQGMYFFRLFMFTLLILIFASFFFSLVMKKLIFDRHIAEQFKAGEKIRNLEFEGVIIQRSKLFQMGFSVFLFAIFVMQDMNFYSVTRIKDAVIEFNLAKGATVVVDNRFNCLNCKFQLNDGDLIVFGRGYFGQVMARAGEFVGQVSHDPSGRAIASTNVQEVPAGHVAVKASNGKDIVFVKTSEITGKIRN
jgi:hypothetical protein